MKSHYSVSFQSCVSTVEQIVEMKSRTIEMPFSQNFFTEIKSGTSIEETGVTPYKM